jgi:hypothetical protein
MKKVLLVVCVLATAGAACAALGDVNPDGLTGLWRFQDSTNKLTATIGSDIVTSNTGNSAWFSGPWTDLGVPEWHTMYSDGGVVQERAWDYLTVNPNFTANGGGSYVNEYTIVMDYTQTSGQSAYNSLFQTADTGNASDGDLFIRGDQGARTIGVGATGYSTLTFDSATWHRIVLSVDNSNFFRVYIDGVLFLDAAGQGVDGRFSLYTDHFHLFADDSWEDQWGLVGTVATWNRAMGSAEVADLGGWIGGSATPTALILVPEPATLAMLGLGALGLIKRRK